MEMHDLTQAFAEENRWALVTGASAGIGAEFSRQLAALGYQLVLVARREERLQELATVLRNDFGTHCLVCPLDLASPGATTRLAAQLAGAGIPIEFLVNNAGYGLAGHFTDPSWKSHEDFVQVLVTAVCELTWCLLPAMQARKKGYIVNVASLAALVPGTAGHTLYGASKAFLVGFSESLAAENHATGVRVSALCPGFTYSEFHDVSGTRELVSRMPDWMWMGAEEVVRYGLNSVMGQHLRVVAVPGRINRLIARMMRCLPTTVTLWMSRRMSRRFRAQKGSVR
jgi:short-subunit dehydrogenase